MNNIVFKSKIKMIIGCETPEVACDKIIQLFNENKRYRLSFLDSQGFEQETHIWAKNQNEALSELEKKYPNATYIFIDKI